MKKTSGKFKKGDIVFVTYYRTPVAGKITGTAKRTSFDPLQNYKVKIEGRTETFNEHWLKQA